MKWIALFSQTGSELTNLSLMFKPNLVLTNNMGYSGKLRAEKYPTAGQVYERMLDYSVFQGKEPCIVTLHGWLKIIPKEYISSSLPIFNGHPAPITVYPELKGMDPQERLWEGIARGKYKHIGTVIHEVTPGVDEGPIILTNLQRLSDLSLNELADLDQSLRSMSLELWKQFLEVKLHG